MLGTSCHIKVFRLVEQLHCHLRLHIMVDLIQVLHPALCLPFLTLFLGLVVPCLLGLPHGSRQENEVSNLDWFTFHYFVNCS